MQGAGYSLSPTIFRSVFFAVNNQLSTWSNYFIMSRNRRMQTSLNSKLTVYAIELKAESLYDCGVDRIFCQPKWINSFEDTEVALNTVMILEQIFISVEGCWCIGFPLTSVRAKETSIDRLQYYWLLSLTSLCVFQHMLIVFKEKRKGL